MKEKFMRFMIGRYGSDQFSKTMLGIALAFFILDMFTSVGFLQPVAMVLIFYVYFRMFSRNIPKRYAENQKYMQYHNKVIQIFKREKKVFEQRKEYRIFKCPQCKQRIRVPKGRGLIEIRCTKCGHTFRKKS